MILILSNSKDVLTTLVIEWLDSIDNEWIRLNGDDSVNINFLSDDVRIIQKDKSFLLSKIKSCWYRRNGIMYNFGGFLKQKELRSFQRCELSKIMEYIYYLIRQKKTINSFENSDVNKLIVNHEARKLNITTPKDLLFSTKECLLKSTKEGTYITKPISGDSIQRFDGFSIFNYTTLLNKEHINTETFFPSLIQNYIEKKYELRIFYLEGNFYSMAIFSQRDSQTSVDFRVYNKIRPNRNVPFQLPKKIEKKLDLLMKNLNLNCGSIDMIVTPENEYVFLEVNPIGQFGMVSYPCNYNLEKLIAESL